MSGVQLSAKYNAVHVPNALLFIIARFAMLRTMFSCVPPGWALIFDMDGVIVDSMPMHTKAWRAYLKRMGIDSDDDLARRMHGRRNDELVAELIAADLPPQTVFEHGAAKERMYREMMSPVLSAHLVPGVTEFLDACEGAPMAVATNAEPANVDFVLDGADLRRCFQAIVDGHQVARPKPHPDVYLRAAELLKTPPERCIVFEDSPAGVAAARSAGA